MTLLHLFLVGLACFAQSRSNLYTKPEVKVSTATTRPIVTGAPKRKGVKHNTSFDKGNLDSEILVQSSSFRSEENSVIVPTTMKAMRLKGLKVGDVIRAVIPESVIAFPEGKAPVRAKVENGELKGSTLIGEASLEKNSKRILIEFKKLTPANSTDLFQLAASALDAKGILGVEGVHFDQSPKFFAAEFLAAGAAGYADASINRSQNAFGNYVEAPTVDTINKKALASALSKTAERFSEKVKSAPEYSLLEGPIEIQIIITDQPRLIE